MKKRLFACIMSVVLLASLFSGCNSSEKRKNQGSYYRLENNHKNYYIKIFSSGRVSCKNVYLGILWGGQSFYLTGTGTGNAEKYRVTTKEAYYNLTLTTSDYKLRNYRGQIIGDGKDLGEDEFSVSLSENCKVITKNAIKYRK